MATTQSPDTDSLFNATPRRRVQLVQLQTTLSLQMNKPAFQLKPLGAALHLKTTQKKQVSTIQRNIHQQLYDSLADTPVERAILLSQSTSHTGAHLRQPSSEAYEAEDRCFRVSVARRLMLLLPAAPNATDVVQSCPNKKRSRPDLQQTSGHATGPLQRMSLRRRCRPQACSSGAMSRRRHTITQGRSRYSLNRKYLLSHVLSTVKVSMHAWTSFSTSTDQSHIWMSLLLLLSLAIRPWSQQPAQDQDSWPKELRMLSKM